jgi:hypothetical protein
MRFILIIALTINVLFAHDSKYLLLGVDKASLNKVLDFKVNCFHENYNVAFIEGYQDVEKLMLFPMKKSSALEIVFSGCDDSSVVVGISFTIDKEKASNIKDILRDIYKAKLIYENGVSSDWEFNNVKIKIRKMAREDHVVSFIGLNS